jgi:hypothetical protein
MLNGVTAPVGAATEEDSRTHRFCARATDGEVAAVHESLVGTFRT